jgi:hypothetical protein
MKVSSRIVCSLLRMAGCAADGAVHAERFGMIRMTYGIGLHSMHVLIQNPHPHACHYVR